MRAVWRWRCPKKVASLRDVTLGGWLSDEASQAATLPDQFAASLEAALPVMRFLRRQAEAESTAAMMPPWGTTIASR